MISYKICLLQAEKGGKFDDEDLGFKVSQVFSVYFKSVLFKPSDLSTNLVNRPLRVQQHRGVIKRRN